MRLTRAATLPAVFILTAFAFAQDAAPEPLRLNVDQGTVTKYGGKTDSATLYAFSFATGSGGARVPDAVRDQLKLAFERDYERLPVAGRAGAAVTLNNSTETVLAAREDGTRVVQVESYAQTSGLIGIGQTTDLKYVRTHAPDGGVSASGITVKVERNRDGLSEDLNKRIIESLEKGVQASVTTQAVVLSSCYRTAPDTVARLILDPKQFMSSGEQSAQPQEQSPVRAGDLRLTRTPDGGAECRVSLEPTRYGLNTGMVSLVSRWTLQFLPDGRLEHSEFVSSTSINNPEVADFEFQGKTYRVQYVRVFRSSGSSDRLE